MKYRHCIFDLYGTLVDIHTDEGSPALWQEMAAWYSRRGAAFYPEELHSAYLRAVAQAGGSAGGDGHEAYPEIRLELVFRQLFQERGVPADMEQAMQAGRRFRELSTEYIRLYDGAKELLGSLRERHIAPDTAVMIGNDGVCDIQGARSVGLDTFYIRSNLSPDEPAPDADYVLEQMDLDRARGILLGESCI